MANIAILVGAKGRGSNMMALIQACRRNLIPGEVRLIVGTAPASPALERAQELDIDTLALSPKDPVYAKKLVTALRGEEIDLVCLAGYLNLLPLEVLRAFPNRVLNIHPALLPKFGGKGMYGLHVHSAVLESGDKVTGCTVHLVNEAYDEGRILLQRRCPVLAGDTAETLAARVLKEEHLAYPEAVVKVLKGNKHGKG